jgi:sulfite exporter TauE/SafE
MASGHADMALSLAALCASGDAAVLPGIAAALFTAAFFGGFAHCAAMCGPFVLMQVAAAAPARLTRLRPTALPGYQLGRLTTYVGLGAVAGGLGATLAELTAFRWLFAVLLALAALSFLAQALQRLGGVVRLRPFERLGLTWGAVLSRLALRWSPRAGFGGYPLGLVLGLLPCGFLYSALMAAAGSGGVLPGALAMAAFALGTMPALLTVSLIGRTALGRWRGAAAVVAAPVFLLNAAILAALALRMVA